MRELMESIEKITEKAYADDYDPYQAILDLMRIHELILEYAQKQRHITSFDMAVLDSITLLEE